MSIKGTKSISEDLARIIISDYQANIAPMGYFGSKYDFCTRTLKKLLDINNIESHSLSLLTLEFNKKKIKVVDPKLLEIFNEYKNGKLTRLEICKKYGIANHKFSTFLYKNNLRLDGSERRGRYKKYSIDDNYFEVINTPEKAYWLGWMYSDGYNRGNGLIRIKIKKEDGYILEEFKKAVGYTGKITLIKDKYVCLAMYSKKMAADLIKLKCIPAKSLVLEFPTEEQIPHKFMSHFLRGYFDGDGGIWSVVKKDRPNGYVCWYLAFTSSSIFINELNLFLSKELNIPTVQPRVSKKNPKTSAYMKCGNKMIPLILNYLCKDGGDKLRLTRKYTPIL